MSEPLVSLNGFDNTEILKTDKTKTFTDSSNASIVKNQPRKKFDNTKFLYK